MCPACLSTLALMFAGVTSTGGLTLLVVRKLRGQSGAANVDPKLTPVEVEIMSRPGCGSRNLITEGPP